MEWVFADLAMSCLLARSILVVGMMWEWAYFGYPSSQERAHKEFKPLQFRLEHDKREVRFRVHGPSHLFNRFQLHWPRSAPWQNACAVRLDPSYLLLYPLHNALNHAGGIWQQLRRGAFVYPCSCQGLQVARSLRYRRRRDRGEDVSNVIVHPLCILNESEETREMSLKQECQGDVQCSTLKWR